MQQAQQAYDTQLISDPTWVRPMIDETYYVDVPYTVQIQNTRQETITNQVATTTTQSSPGLIAKAYNMLGYNNAPPLPDESRLVSTETVSNINFQWGGGNILTSGLSEDVIVNFTGNINAPIDGTYLFYAPGDDGVQVLIDGVRIINDWRDKGGGGTTVSTQLTAGSHAITLWYYENGGGANVWLYWTVPGATMTIVPSSAFDIISTTTIYEDVSTVIDVIYYTEQTLYRREERTRQIPDANASAPLINNPDLLTPIANAQNILNMANTELLTSKQSLSLAQSIYDASVLDQSQKSSIIESTSNDVNTAQQELNVAQQELEAIPSFREPTPTPTPSQSTIKEPTQNVVQPTPSSEPSAAPETQPEPKLSIDPSTINPETLSSAEVVKLVSEANLVLATAAEGSPEYNKALDALFVAAQADDIKVPEELAAIPGVGQAAVAAIAAINFVGNVGADMAPATREKAKKEVIAAVVATGAAISATTISTSSAPSGGSGGSSGGNSKGNERTESNKPNRRETR
ncbi:MAG: PA14 domain-containing protein [Bacteroidota bacterium]